MFADSSGDDLGYNGFPVSLNYFSGLPDVNSLENSNVVVIFKSLMKKDSITKEKSLAEFSKLIDEESINDDHLIMLWLQLYPKLAIDNSRNVRILAHQIQSTILIKVGGKSFSKYLKTCLPVWLLGLYDPDKQVSNAVHKGLLESFQQDTERVNVKIWGIFKDAILNIIQTIVCQETEESLSDARYTKQEDSRAKYERILDASISILIKMLSLIDKGEISIVPSDDSCQIISQSLSLEKLWDHLGPCLDKNTMNVLLFKSLLSLLKIMYSSSANIEAAFPELKNLYKLTSKKFIKHVKLSPKSSQLYAPFILQFWDLLVTMTNFPSLTSLKVKKNFWELGGSKSLSRLTDYLRVGSCRLDPIYYTVLSRFFEVYSKIEVKDESANIFDLKSDDGAKKLFLLILLPQLKTLPPTYSGSFIGCVWKTLALCSPGAQEQFVGPIFQCVTLTYKVNAVDLVLTAVPNDLIEKLKNGLSNVAVLTLGELESGSKSGIISTLEMTYQLDHYVPAYAALLLSAVKNKIVEEEALFKYVQGIIQSIEEERVDVHYIMGIIYSTLKKVSSSADSQLKACVTEFAQTIPAFVEPDFVDVPLDILIYIAASNDPLFESVDVSEAINNCYLKLSMVDESKINYMLSKIQNLSLDISKFPDLYAYVVQLTKKEELSKEERSTIHGIMKDATIWESLLKNAKFNDETSSVFINQTVDNDKTIASLESVQLDDPISENLRLVLSHAWKTCDTVSAGKFLQIAIKSNSRQLADDTLNEIVSHVENAQYFGAIAKFITKDCPDVLGSIIKTIESRFIEGAKKINLPVLSMGNQLLHNTLMFVEPTFNFNETGLDVNLLSYSKFISHLASSEPARFKGLAKSAFFLSDYAHDFFFLATDKELHSIHSDDFLNLEDSLQGTILRACDITLESVVAFFNGSNQHGVLAEFSDILEDEDSNRSVKFYAARALCSIFEHVLGDETKALLDNANIKFNTVLKNPYMAAVLLTSFKHLLHITDKFDRVKNIVASEILGVKGGVKAISDGLIWTSLTNSFIEEGSVAEGSGIPLHRLNMVINQFASWLESESAYDEAFIPVRCQITKFLTGLLTLDASVPDKAFELSGSLVSDNLATVSVEPHLLHLRYLTLKLAKAVDNAPASDTVLEKSSYTNDVLETFVNEDIQAYDENHLSVPVYLCHDQCFHLLTRMDIKTKHISEKANLIEKLFIQSSSLQYQRLSVSMLQRHIAKTQSDFVVEYQLLNTKVSEDLDTSKAKLPDYLVKEINIEHSISLVEDVQASRAFKYLWSWLLVFEHFKDITYSIRNDYVSQLRENELIEKLLDSIFITVDVSSSKLAQSLTSGSTSKQQKLDAKSSLVPNYDVRVGHGDSNKEEIQFLIIHLYYLCFSFVGSYIQSWFNEIRDRLLKQSVEKFSIRFISPIVIERILGQVIASKDALSKDENTVVKVNAVANEIKTIFNIDEQTMEMVIKVPESYPLSLVQVNGPARLGLKEYQWKAWLLASQKIISLVNGSITEAIELFIKNVNMHFSGFEECAICYSILHQDHSLPSKVCTTCLNKFHSACLYKWFKSSGASSCPLCRSAFNFRRPMANAT